MPLRTAGIARAWYRVSALGPGAVFFFFQAEDGIRDVAVTGVQTCALPILEVLPTAGMVEETYELYGDGFRASVTSPFGQKLSLRCWQGMRLVLEEVAADDAQIGRASCRERGWVLGGGVLG